MLFSNLEFQHIFYYEISFNVYFYFIIYASYDITKEHALYSKKYTSIMPAFEKKNSRISRMMQCSYLFFKELVRSYNFGVC